jgi:cell wall-associated NlpC family hydrolase
VRGARLKALAGAATGACLIAGCGAVGTRPPTQPAPATKTAPAAPQTGRSHPQAVQPVAGAAPATSDTPALPAQVSVGPPAGGGSLPQPQPLNQVRAELAAEQRANGLSANTSQATLTPDGLAIAPSGAPGVVQQIINAGNQIAHLPYRFGGGHATYEDTAYDCSGSLSFVFIEAGILNSTVDSGELMTMGDPGPGKWVTIYANAGHTFMYVAGLRFDTVALAATGSRWSISPPQEGTGGFVVRHPPGL